jgi:hypothetical protein
LLSANGPFEDPDVLIGNALCLGGYLVWIRGNPNEQPEWLADVTENLVGPESDCRLVRAGESVLIDVAGRGTASKLGPRWRRISLFQKTPVSDVSKVTQRNEAFADLRAMQKGEPDSEERGFAHLFRALSSGHGCVFCGTSNREFLSVVHEAVRICNFRLICLESTFAKLPTSKDAQAKPKARG